MTTCGGKANGWTQRPTLRSYVPTFANLIPMSSLPLEAVMVFLATEFFDQFFSVTEIRSAFTTALDCLPQYAGGEERRGDKY